VIRSPLPGWRMLRILASNVVAAGLFTLLVGTQGGWSRLVTCFLVSLLYASIIGTAAHLALPRVARRLTGRSPVVFWLGLIGVLFVLSLVGSLVAGAVAAAVGLFGPGVSWASPRSSLGIGFVITLTIGLAIAVHETMRARLDHARESLRERELEVERARRMASDARLASLESRLHPHFLFNALAAIAGQVRESPEHAERLLGEFAELLRASLDSTQRHTVPLGDEVDIVRAYLEIEQARLGERLRAKIDVPDDLRAWPVPPFALHTLAQNSVKHVAAARVEGAEVRVEARRAGDRLALSVWDDGPGLDLARVPPGHGLDSLRARLLVLFGADAGLSAEREAGGARVTISLPPRALIDDGSAARGPRGTRA